MRAMSFLVGGIVGAAAVIYFMNNNRQGLFLLNAGEKVAGKWMNGAVNKMSSSKAEESWSGIGLDTVEQMINEDPEVKKAVQDILNKETTYQTQ